VFTKPSAASKKSLKTVIGGRHYGTGHEFVVLGKLTCGRIIPDEVPTASSKSQIIHIIGTRAVAPCPSRSIKYVRARTMRSAMVRQLA
jgi:hypothetical protein